MPTSIIYMKPLSKSTYNYALFVKYCMKLCTINKYRGGNSLLYFRLSYFFSKGQYTARRNR